VKKVLTKLGIKRTYPFKDVYYGSCWFCLTTKSIEYLLDYSQNNPKVVKFFQHSGCSDELYIQSVLLHSPFKDTFENQIYRFFDWSDNGKSPKILTVEDLPKIQSSSAWFARKLDLEIDPVLFDKLDEINEKTV
jgi:hypothetical protein